MKYQLASDVDNGLTGTGDWQTIVYINSGTYILDESTNVVSIANGGTGLPVCTLDTLLNNVISTYHIVNTFGFFGVLPIYSDYAIRLGEETNIDGTNYIPLEGKWPSGEYLTGYLTTFNETISINNTGPNASLWSLTNGNINIETNEISTYSDVSSGLDRYG